MELWGGVECTVNRVGDRYRDQTRLTGHHDRIGDLQRFAELGLTALRYPVLWERIAPDRSDERDWRWTDERLAEITRLGMRPIAGLVHHGSGPRYTSLVDDSFAPLLADHAAATARRYPWITEWTPVNEPLTTARFSALYGLWYPHAQDDRLFWLALLNQVDATRLAMHTIRAVNPAAQLIQTEDLGRTYATDKLAWQAEYNNHRRWATWDLLCGRVRPDHPLWGELDRFGLGDRMRAIADDPCPPDIIGVNHYVTSDRFLDHRLDRYDLPTPASGYHDLTAARVLDPPPAGLAGVLRETWGRYGVPLAVTESHLGCTREEQLRWIAQSWRTCERLAADGVDLRALTAWALLGNVGWSGLLTQNVGSYEAGVYDIRGGAPRPTAIAGLLASLAGDQPAAPHPVLAGEGWWQRHVRLEHSAFSWGEPVPRSLRERPARPLLVIGATGVLRQAVEDACALRGLAFCLLKDGTDPDRVVTALDRYRPWAMLDFTDHRAACDTATVQRLCDARGVHRTVFVIDDAPAEVMPAALTIRTSALFSPDGLHDFAALAERSLRAGRQFVASDATVTPTYLPDLINASLDLTIDGERGIWQLTSGTALSWAEFARRIAGALGLDPALVVSGDLDPDARWSAVPLSPAAHEALLPSLDDVLRHYAGVRSCEAVRADLARTA